MVDAAYVQQLQDTAFAMAPVAFVTHDLPKYLSQTEGAEAPAGNATPESLSSEIPQPPLPASLSPKNETLKVEASLALRQLIYTANEVAAQIDAGDPAAPSHEMEADRTLLLRAATNLSEVLEKPVSMDVLNAALAGAAKALADGQDNDSPSLQDESSISQNPKKPLSAMRKQMANKIRAAILQPAPEEHLQPTAQPLPVEVDAYITKGVEQASTLALTGAVVGIADAYALQEQQQTQQQGEQQVNLEQNISQGAIHNAMMSGAFSALSDEHKTMLRAVLPELASQNAVATGNAPAQAAGDQAQTTINAGAAQQLQEMLFFAENNLLSPEAVTAAFNVKKSSQSQADAGMSEEGIKAGYVLALAALSENYSAIERTMMQRAVVKEAPEPYTQEQLADSKATPQVIITQSRREGTVAPEMEPGKSLNA